MTNDDFLGGRHLAFIFFLRPLLLQVEVTHKFATPKTLVQQYLFIPAKHKDCYLAYVLNEFAGQSTIVFVSTCNNAQVGTHSELA